MAAVLFDPSVRIAGELKLPAASIRTATKLLAEGSAPEFANNPFASLLERWRGPGYFSRWPFPGFATLGQRSPSKRPSTSARVHQTCARGSWFGASSRRRACVSPRAPTASLRSRLSSQATSASSCRTGGSLKGAFPRVNRTGDCLDSVSANAHRSWGRREMAATDS
jgi:hypothetical protein